ncbi:MAG TPA: alpha/beta hydrolase, partial [Firmicutes bacterium]|nr:alpha/beta hydrolase [Bacillota bacterium]
QRLAANTKAILGQVTAPALIIQTKDDQTVRPASAKIIHRRLSSLNKECFWLEKGTHNVPVVAPYNERIIDRIIEFIEHSQAN